MNIGLYFGSFNPIHTGHLIIASHIINETDLKEIWFVVSPQNPFKLSKTLLNENHRLNLVRLAIDEDSRFKASNIEFKLPKPSYTINTLVYLAEKYPEYTFSIIMGSDGYQNLEKWKNADQIIKNYQILVYNRPGHNPKIIEASNTIIMDAPLLEISSTHIRKLLREKKSIKYLVPGEVKHSIEINNYYGNNLENPAEQ